MAKTFHTTVHVHSIKNEMHNRTMAFGALPATITKENILGRALTVDPAFPCAMKLTADNDPIVARCEVYEERGVVTAQFQFTDLLPVKDGDAVAVGDTVIGAALGEVKKATANDPRINFVAELVTRSGKKFAAVVKLS